MKNPILYFDSLLLYRPLPEPFPALQKLCRLLNEPNPTLSQVQPAYFSFVAEALKHNWPKNIPDFILSHLNTFSQNPQPELFSAAAWDLNLLQKLAQISAFKLKQLICQKLSLTANDLMALKAWPEIPALPSEALDNPLLASGYLAEQRQKIKETLVNSVSWSLALPHLQQFYQKNGGGIFNQFAAFYWQENPQGAYLRGLNNLDPLRLENLINLESEHQQILANTDRFVQSLPASNLILYGDRGSGKSSTVKALIHHYIQDNLRLVELNKASLAELPNLMRYLTTFKHRFIIFIDDLSFENADSQYKWLKTALEGGLETKPQNILFYVTSNRRHLIQENLEQSEARPQDSIQEKMSLADRFGQTIIFTNPNQKGYLQIVEQLAQQAGLPQPPKEQALQWALWHNGSSGRTARQFIDYLKQEA